VLGVTEIATTPPAAPSPDPEPGDADLAAPASAPASVPASAPAPAPASELLSVLTLVGTELEPLERPTETVVRQSQRNPGAMPGKHRRGRLLPHPTEWLLIGAFAGCVLLVAYAYRTAATPGSDPMAPFTPFWAGLLGWLGLACWVLLRAGSTRFQRSFTLVLTGLVMSLPKLARTPDLPVFFDEIAHWGQTEQMVRTGQVYRFNVVAILQDYPGLHALTTAVQQVTHLSVWQVGTVLVLAMRTATPLLVRELARAARLPNRICDLAGLVYTLNPGFLFFTGMFAYESTAIVFQLAALTIALRLLVGPRGEAGAHARVLLVLAAAATVTHHLTSLFLLLMILVVPLVSVGSWATRRGRKRLLLTAAQVSLLIVAWTAANLSTVWAYLGVFPQRAAEQLGGLVRGLTGGDGASRASGGGGRSLLSNTGLPGYETLLALLSVPLALGLAALGLWWVRDRLRSTALRTLVVIALAYPASLPLVLTVSGAPGAHRSWPFSYQALAVLIAVAAGTLAQAGQPGRRTVRRGLVALALAALLVGNCASENHAVLRFPGPYEPGTEGRVQSPELIATATWAGHELGGTGSGLSDYFTTGYVSAFGGARVASGFPGWDLLFYTTPPKRETVNLIRPDGVGYLVVDRRMSTGVFRTGFYLDASEPGAGVRSTPIPAAALTKFERYPWMQKVWSSTDYDVYRFDMDRWRDPALLPTRRIRPGAL
jgi:hypothetical protein